MEYFNYQREQAITQMQKGGRAIISYPGVENPANNLQFDDGSRAIYLGNEHITVDMICKFKPSRNPDTYFVYDPAEYDVAVVPNEVDGEANYQLESLRQEYSIGIPTSLGYTVFARRFEYPKFRKVK